MLTQPQKESMEAILRKARQDFDQERRFLSQLMPIIGSRRNLSLAITELERSREWLGYALSHLGAAYPYEESRDASSNYVAPSADLVPVDQTLPLYNPEGTLYSNIQLVKEARRRNSDLTEVLRDLLEIMPEDEIYKGVRLHQVLFESWTHLKQSSFSLGNLLPELAEEAERAPDAGMQSQSNPITNPAAPTRLDGDDDEDEENDEADELAARKEAITELVEMFGHLLTEPERALVLAIEDPQEVFQAVVTMSRKFAGLLPHALVWGNEAKDFVAFLPDPNGKFFLVGSRHFDALGDVLTYEPEATWDQDPTMPVTWPNKDTAPLEIGHLPVAAPGPNSQAPATENSISAAASSPAPADAPAAALPNPSAPTSTDSSIPASSPTPSSKVSSEKPAGAKKPTSPKSGPGKAADKAKADPNDKSKQGSDNDENF